MARAGDRTIKVDPTSWAIAECIVKVYTMLGARRPDKRRNKRVPTPAAILADALTLGLKQLCRDCPSPESGT